MTFAMLCPFPPDRDGIAIYSQRLARAFIARKWQPFVIWYSRFRYEESYVHGMLSKHNPFSYIRIAFALRSRKFTSLLIEHEYLYYNILFFPFFIGLLRLLGIRSTIVMHTVAPFDRGVKRFIFRMIDSSVLLCAGTVFVHTEHAKQRLQKSSFVKREIRVVNIPVPIIELAPAKLRRPRFLCFGFAYPDKSFETAIEAMDGVDADLVVAASLNPRMLVGKKYLETLRTLAAGKKNVKLIDRYVSDDERRKLFQDCTAMIFPYRFIEQSAVLSESWGAGRIPVCSDIPAFKEEIQTTGAGLLFRKGDPADLRRVLRELASSPQLQKKLEAAVRKVAAERSFETLSGEFMRVVM